MAIIDKLNSYFINDEINGYVGSTMDYFVNNLVEFEKFVARARNPKFKQKYGKTAYQALAQAIFEDDGISTLEGKPLNPLVVGDYLCKAKKKLAKKGVKKVATASKDVAPIFVAPVVSSPSVKVESPVVATISSVSSFSEANYKKADNSWTQEDFMKANELLKKDGWTMQVFNEKAVYQYGLFETNMNKPIPWNDELEILYILSKARYPKLDDKMSSRREAKILESHNVLYGKFWDFLKKCRN